MLKLVFQLKNVFGLRSWVLNWYVFRSFDIPHPLAPTLITHVKAIMVQADTKCRGSRKTKYLENVEFPTTAIS